MAFTLITAVSCSQTHGDDDVYLSGEPLGSSIIYGVNTCILASHIDQVERVRLSNFGRS